MASKNVQFAVAAHIMAVLGYYDGKQHEGGPVTSGVLAGSVNTEVTFVRRIISKLVKAGLVTATRGKTGSCSIARPANEITMLDIYRASESPEAFTVHSYAPEAGCPVSPHFKAPMNGVLAKSQKALEDNLAAQLLSDLVKDIRKKKR
jgi:DNA-binding IscR family transcriptional regulator